MSAPTRVRQGHIHAPIRPRFRHVLESELIKLTSLRSTALLAAALLVLGLGVSVLFAVTLESGGVPSAHSVAFSLDAITLGTVLFGQIIAGVLGVLAISAEYSSGTIQPTLIAVPRRSPIIVAKALVLFPAVTATAFIALLGSWAATYPIYAGYDIQTELTEPGFFSAILGGAVYVGLCAVCRVPCSVSEWVRCCVRRQQGRSSCSARRCSPPSSRPCSPLPSSSAPSASACSRTRVTRWSASVTRLWGSPIRARSI